MKNTIRLAVALTLTTLALGACGVESSSTTGGAPKTSAKLPAALALASEPAGAKSVKETVAAARSGDEVIVTGRVGVEGSDRAYFTLVDASLKACSETAMNDPCETPWDFCCSPPDELAKVSALIQFRDGAELYPGNVLGFDGLAHLKHVAVKGKAEKDSSGNLTVVASGIYVQP